MIKLRCLLKGHNYKRIDIGHIQCMICGKIRLHCGRTIEEI